jgi:tRNA-dihydrouridine synthase B
MKIGNMEFENNVFLAPMAGVTDIAFRGLCKVMGCGLTYTEMISSRGLYYGSENTEKMLEFSREEKPAAVQIFGNDPLVMAKTCDFLNGREDVCIIDINMGCPAPKIVKNGDGSALMKDPELASKIVEEVKRASSKPVTVKFRKGFDERSINAVEFGKVIEAAGADAITVHGRTREQMYEGRADWDIIRQVKAVVRIPVIGNGDIVSSEGAERMLEETKCDGVMIGRGAMGNPWIFREIIQKEREEQVVYPKDYEKIDICIKHYRRALFYFGEDKAVREMRKHIGWYIKGLKNCTEIKNAVNVEKGSAKVIEILEQYKSELM